MIEDPYGPSILQKPYSFSQLSASPFPNILSAPIYNSGVGKTSVLKRLIYKNFSETYKATIGVDFGFYKVTLDNGE